MGQEHCIVCQKPLVPGRYYFCDQEEGPFCDEHFEALDCEKKHGECCSTTVWDDGK